MPHNTKSIVIVTTAAPPWLTGTAVNPALRAAFLAKFGHKVTLVVPFLPIDEQPLLFPDGFQFSTPEQQTQFVLQYLRKRAGFDCHLNIAFYTGRYDKVFCSILPVGDLTTFVPPATDLVILEEPEHLTWHHHGPRWTSVCPLVVGIMHTNYIDYVRREAGEVAAQGLARLNRFLVRAHCHKVIKLSDAVQSLPRETTLFVHGVSEGFLEVGRSKAACGTNEVPRFSRGAYFLGKVLWAKGYRELLDVLHYYQEKKKRIRADNDASLQELQVWPGIDLFGKGDHLDEVKAEAEHLSLNVTFHGAKDHLDPLLHQYTTFINPSTSDVVATTSAEALAMGKWLICAQHPCNTFFATFRNCLIYTTPDEFCERLDHALTHEPHPLTEEEQNRLSWSDATVRLLDAAFSPAQDQEAVLKGAVHDLTWKAYNSLLGIELIRRAVGAGRNTKNAPDDMLDSQLQRLASCELYPQGIY